VSRIVSIQLKTHLGIILALRTRAHCILDQGFLHLVWIDAKRWDRVKVSELILLSGGVHSCDTSVAASLTGDVHGEL